MSRRPDITWQPSIEIDQTVRYDADAPAELFDYDDWSQTRAHIKGLTNLARVDTLVQLVSQENTLWLVEVKDLRHLRGQPHAKNLAHLDQTLAKKLSDTLTFIKENGEVPQNLHDAVAEAQHLYYVVHIELPDVPPAYFPSGYPLSQFQSFLSSPERSLVHGAFLRDAQSINQDDSLPWTATLIS